MLRLLLCLFTAAAPGIAPAAETGHAHGAMSADRSAQGELGATAAFDAKGDLWAAHKVSGHIAVSRSSDRGRSWSNPVLVTPAPELTDAGAGGDAHKSEENFEVHKGPADCVDRRSEETLGAKRERFP